MQIDDVIRLSLRVWTPVFDSIQNAMNPDCYHQNVEPPGAA
jgi:hypothetical protein